MSDSRIRIRFTLLDLLVFTAIVAIYVAASRITDFHLRFVLVNVATALALMSLLLRKWRFLPVWCGSLIGVCLGGLWSATMSPVASYPPVDRALYYTQDIAIFAVVGALAGFAVLLFRRSTNSETQSTQDLQQEDD